MDLQQRPQSLKHFLPGPLEKGFLGIPWWSSGYDSSLSPLRAPVQSLIRELRSHKQPQHTPQKRKGFLLGSMLVPRSSMGSAYHQLLSSIAKCLPRVVTQTYPPRNRHEAPVLHILYFQKFASLMLVNWFLIAISCLAL